MNGDASAQPPDGPERQEPTGTSGMAVAGLVLAFFCGLFGLLFSIMGLSEVRRSGGRIGGERLAVAGIVISILNVLVWVWWRVSLR